jgi:hypothetical protein
MKAKYILSLFLLVSTLSLCAQEVSIKKKSVFVDGVEELKRDDCNIGSERTKCVVTSVKTQQPVFSIYIRHYLAIDKIVVDVNFIDFDGTCRMTIKSFKALYMDIYKMKVIDKDGKVDVEKAKAFIRLYHEKDSY